MTREQRRKAIIKRRIFLCCCAAILIALAALIAFTAKAVLGNKEEKPKDSSSSGAPVSSEDVSSDDTPSYPDTGIGGLDAKFEILTLVNDKTPLPDNYDYEGNLTTIPTKYINGMLNQIDKDVWTYMQAMIDAQRATEQDPKTGFMSARPTALTIRRKCFMKIRSSASLTRGLSQAEAEDKAATVVTRPGRSEHNTGFSADFNIAEDSFESTPMFTWMQENAAEYGFVLRFSQG